MSITHPHAPTRSTASAAKPEAPKRGRALRHPRAYLGLVIFTAFMLTLAVTFLSLRG